MGPSTQPRRLRWGTISLPPSTAGVIQIDSSKAYDSLHLKNYTQNVCKISRTCILKIYALDCI